MTFCLGMRCATGLVGLADTRLTSGDIDLVVTGKKIYLYQADKHALFIMVSGLKVISDEVITYLNTQESQLLSCNFLYEGVDHIVRIIRDVREREEPWLTKDNYQFDLNCIIGGQFAKDTTSQLFRIFPEGSWKRIAKDTPYEIIGEVKYGKPVLDRAFTQDTSLERALMIGLIAFDSTRKSSPLVYLPIDILKYKTNSFKFTCRRLEYKDLVPLRKEWETRFDQMIDQLMELDLKLFKP